MARSRIPAILVSIATTLVVLYGACSSGGGGGDASNRVLPNTDLDWRDQVIYQLLTDRFADGDVNNNWNVDRTALAKYQGGDFEGVIDHLDYLQALGVTAIWISPVVKNVEDDAGVAGYHGYWTQDFTRTNPHFGTLSDLRRMVNACHDRGILVICDIVTNHIGQLFYYDINDNGVPEETQYGSNIVFTYPDPYMRILEYDPPWQPMGVQTAVGNPTNQQGWARTRWLDDHTTNHIPPEPYEFQNFSWYHRFGRVVPEPGGNWPFVEVQLGDFPGGDKDIATERPDVREALVGVFADWIANVDFDGFRIDTLKHIERAEDIVAWQNFMYEDPSTHQQYSRNMYQYPDGYHHPLAPAGRTYPANYPGFWEVFCPAMRKAALAKGKHNFFMFGESYDGDDALCGSYTRKGLSNVTDAAGNYSGQPGEGMLDSVFNFPEKYQIDSVIAYGNATTNLQGVIDGKSSNYDTTPHPNGVGIPPANIPVNFIDNHDVTRFINHCGSDAQKALAKLHMALAYIFAREGVPCVYYGTEQVFVGTGPMGDMQVVFAGRGDPTNREVLWDTGFDTTKPTFRWISKLSQIRKQHVALRRGTQAVRWSTNHGAGVDDAGIFALERIVAGTEAVLFVMNVSDQTSHTHHDDNGTLYTMQVSFAPGTTLIDLLDPAGATVQVSGSSSTLDIPVAPLSVHLYAVP